MATATPQAGDHGGRGPPTDSPVESVGGPFSVGGLSATFLERPRRGWYRGVARPTFRPGLAPCACLRPGASARLRPRSRLPPPSRLAHPVVSSAPPASVPAPRLSSRVAARLRGIVGDGGFLEDADRLLVYESDGLTQYRVAPSAVVLPRSVGEVAEVLRVLDEAEVPVVPRGAGTGLSGGALATQGGVIVGTARMNRILEVDPVNRRARVEPGVVNALLTRATLPHGLIYAPDPSSQSACTLGGNVAENSGGPHCLKYGVTSRYVTALTVVLPSGEQVRLGGPEAEGELDLAGLFVGSEGCFGVAVEIEVALVPAPEGVRTLLGIFPTMESAGEAVTGIMARGLLPAALEIVDQATIRAVEASVFAAGFPTDAGAALVVEFDGVEAGLDAELDAAAAECRTAGAREIRLAASASERDALWRGRKKAFGAMGRIAPDLLVQDATVPRSRLPAVLARISEIGRRHDLTVANVFHAGDGNLHPNLLFDRRDPDQLARVEEASREIMAACIEAGGTITGEHGVGIDKRRYLPLVCPPPVLRVLGEVRRVFDPSGRCNPGKVLPDGWGPPSPPLLPGSVSASDPVGDSAGMSGDSGASRAPGAPGASRASGASPVLEYEPADLVIRMDASATLADLAREAARAGQWLPFDPPGGDTLTLADAIALGRSGPLSAGFGRIRDHVLGLTLLTHGGERLPLGGRVVKNVAGFDLVRLAVGSGHRLGRIEDVTLRLFPLPERDRTLLWECPEAASALALGRDLVAMGMPVAALHAFGGLLPGSGSGRAGVRLAVRMLGSEEAVARMEEGLRGGQGRSAPPQSTMEGADSVAWWGERALEAGGATPELAGTRNLGSGGRPASVEALLRAFMAVPGGDTPAATNGLIWSSAHLLDGRVDVRLSPDRVPGPGTPERRRLEEAVAAAGGALRVEGEEPAVSDPVRARLLRGVEAVFTGTYGAGARLDEAQAGGRA